MNNDLVFTPIRQLAELLKSRQISPMQLSEIFLDRLEQRGPSYNALTTLTRERASRQAEQAEREISAGDYKGPLHGIPWGAKDLLATSDGIPTSWGAAPLKDQTFDFDATVVRRLEEAGAVLDRSQMLSQVQQLVTEGSVITDAGNKLVVSADTLCVHGDHAEGVEGILEIQKLLSNE